MCHLFLYFIFVFFFLMIRRPPRSTRTDTLFPYTTLFRSERSALTEAMIAAGVSMGLPLRSDPNAPDGGEGIGYAARNIFDGRRQDAATAFLDPVRSRPNLIVVTDAPVQRLRFEQRRAVAAQLMRNGRSEEHTSELQSLMRISYAVFCLHTKTHL